MASNELMKIHSNLEETRDRILKAAKTQFLSKGYDSTRLDDIVRDAHVSKTTIYKIFGGKRELFMALNDSIIEEVLNSIQKPQTQHAPTLETVRSYLTKLGTEYLTSLTQYERLALLRLNISIATRFNNAATNFYKAGPGTMLSMLSDYLNDVDESNVLEFSNPTEAAGQFLALIRGNHHLQALLNDDYQISSETITNYVTSVVTLFINAHQAPSAS